MPLAQVEELIFEASYKFIINKNFSVHSEEWKLIQAGGRG